MYKGSLRAIESVISSSSASGFMYLIINCLNFSLHRETDTFVPQMMSWGAEGSSAIVSNCNINLRQTVNFIRFVLKFITVCFSKIQGKNMQILLEEGINNIWPSLDLTGFPSYQIILTWIFLLLLIYTCYFIKLQYKRLNFHMQLFELHSGIEY